MRRDRAWRCVDCVAAWLRELAAITPAAKRCACLRLHTIYVPTFTNVTQSYRIEQTFTAAVVRELRSRTNYRIVTTNDGTADATLNGTVTSVYIRSR